MRGVAVALAFVILLSAARAVEVEIYTGEPFAEALHDVVVSGAIAVSHNSVKASSLDRIDAFKLRDGRILILHARSTKIGEPYTIKKIAVTPSPDGGKTEVLSKFKLPPSAPATR